MSDKEKENNLIDSGMSESGLGSVSYTHLDVYKRQAAYSRMCKKTGVFVRFKQYNIFVVFVRKTVQLLLMYGQFHEF